MRETSADPPYAGADAATLSGVLVARGELEPKQTELSLARLGTDTEGGREVERVSLRHMKSIEPGHCYLFRMQPVEPGRYRCELLPYGDILELELQSGESRNVDFKVDAQTSLTIHLAESPSHPFPGLAHVNWRPLDEGAPRAWRVAPPAKVTGAHLCPVEPGQVELRVVVPGFRPLFRTVDVVPGLNDLDLVLEAVSLVELVVECTRDGQLVALPVEFWTGVRASSAGKPTLFSTAVPAETGDGATSRATFRLEGAGTHTLHFSSLPGYVPIAERVVDVPAGGATIQLVLQPERP